MALQFSLLSDSNTTTENEVVRIASQAYTIGDAVMLDRVSDSVDVVPATSATTTYGIYGIALQTVPSTATTLLIQLIEPQMKYAADSTNAANASHNYQRMVLTDKGTVNNTGTDSSAATAVFMQTGIVGTNRIVGKFLKVSNVTA